MGEKARMGKIGVGLGAVAMCLLMVLSSSAAASSASAVHSHNGPAMKKANVVAGCNYVNFVTLYSAWSYNNTTTYGCTMSATDWQGASMTHHGWGPIYEVYCIGSCDIKVTIKDQGYVGDYYGLWVTTDSTFATSWGQIGATPQVKTGAQLTAPSYNAKWTGTGTTLSKASFNVYFPSGVAEYLRIYDALWGGMGAQLDGPCGVTASTLLSSGCTATGISVSSGWSPAGYSVTWVAAP